MGGALTGFLWALGAAGRPGRELAVRLDLLRSVGPAHAWRRRRRTPPPPDALDDELSPAYDAIWRDAAREVGAEVFALPGGFLELRAHGRTVRVWNHWVPLDDAVTIRLALQKELVHRLLAEVGLPVPEHLAFDRRDLEPARAFLERDSTPCVVKPVSLSGGSGATAGIRTVEQLRRAALRAGRSSGRLLVERQVAGDVYRVLLLDGEPLDVIRRRPARVVGDGSSTVEELLAAENRRRAERRGEDVDVALRIDLDCVLALEAAGLGLRSVPAEGEEVAVKSVTSQNRAEDNETVREGVGRELIADCGRAAVAVGLRLAGVDLVTVDPSRPLAEVGGAILEVNGTPGLHYHYEVADRAGATKVAAALLAKVLA